MYRTGTYGFSGAPRYHNYLSKEVNSALQERGAGHRQARRGSGEPGPCALGAGPLLPPGLDLCGPHLVQRSQVLREGAYVILTQSSGSKHIKGSKDRCLLGQNTTCEFSGVIPFNVNMVLNVHRNHKVY